MWWVKGTIGEYGSARGCDQAGQGAISSNYGGNLPPGTKAHTYKCSRITSGANEGRYTLMIYIKRV